MSDVVGEAGIEVTAEEQAAADRMDAPADTGDIPEGYNADGTIKEELILGKFKTNEDLQKAYEELEKKLGQPKTPEATPEPDKVVPDEVKGLITPDDFTAFSKEYNETGALTEETYKTLEAKGLSKQVIDAYIEGQKALAETKANKLLNYVGGQDKYNSMVEWAKSNYTAEQGKLFDDALFSGDEARVQEQVDLLAFRMTKGQVRRLEGSSVDTGSSALKPFEHKQEWQRYVANPMYGKDSKYTRMVDNRYLRSLESGTL